MVYYGEIARHDGTLLSLNGTPGVLGVGSWASGTVAGSAKSLRARGPPYRSGYSSSEEDGDFEGEGSWVIKEGWRARRIRRTQIANPTPRNIAARGLRERNGRERGLGVWR